MDIDAAMKRTIREAELRVENGKCQPTSIEAATLPHLRSMAERMNGTFSYGKLCRWLGYAQGVLVARGILTLEECKQINKECSDDHRT